MKTIDVKLPNLVEEKYNDPNAIIAMRFVSLDVEKRSANIQISLLVDNVAVENFTVSDVRVTEYTMDWFTKRRPVYEDGEAVKGEFLTGFRKFLKRHKMDLNLPITALKFTSRNHSEDYYSNPFRLTLHKKYDSATIQLVNMPSQVKWEREDPTSGEVSEGWYYKRHRQSNEILKLRPSNYRRFEIRNV